MKTMLWHSEYTILVCVLVTIPLIFEDINAFLFDVCIKLIQIDCKVIYDITKYFSLK